MYKLTERFTSYCQANLDLTGTENYDYQSLSVCLIDCVYSLRAQYYSVTVPVVSRYAAAYMGGDPNRPGDTVSMLLQRINELGGPEVFANQVLGNHQKLGGRHMIPKEAALYQLAQYLNYLHIDTLEDFQKFESSELLEIVVRAVKGIGDAGMNYLFMLAGDPNRCKPDVHIHTCITEACGCDIPNEECQILFTETVANLHADYPNLTIRGLDGIVWRKFQSQS